MVHLGVEEQAIARIMTVARMRVGKRLNCFIRLIRTSLPANIMFSFFNSNVESYYKRVETHHKASQIAHMRWRIRAERTHCAYTQLSITF